MARRTLLAALVSVGVALAGCGDGGEGAVGDEATVVDASDDIREAGPAEEGIDGVVAYRVTSADHTNGSVTYPVSPPPGGPHRGTWVNCGFHEAEFDDENLVHDLEHGAVWLAYSPDLPAEDLDVLRALAADHKVVAAPYPALAGDEAVVATAWARQLRLDSVGDPRLQQFVVLYEDGGQAPEAGVTCLGSRLG